MRRMLDVDMTRKISRGRENLSCNDTQAGLKEDNTTKRTAWGNKIISYVPATPNDRTNQIQRIIIVIGNRRSSCVISNSTRRGFRYIGRPTSRSVLAGRYMKATGDRVTS